MTDAQFEALKKRAAKASRLGYEARSVIDELVAELIFARGPVAEVKPKRKAKAKKVAP